MNIITIVKKMIPPIFIDIIKCFYHFIKKEEVILTSDKNIELGGIELYKKTFGTKNPDKHFYIIKGVKNGMFSALQYVIAHIRQAEMLDMIPVVDFENFITAYTSEEAYNNEKNVWLWFFNPITPYSLEEVYSSKNVYFSNGKYDWNMGFYFSEHHFYDIYQKYIFLRNEIFQKVNDYLKNFNFNNKRILGIQFRGWEMNIAPGHPFCPTIKQMFSCTDEIINKYNIELIYLATEQQEYHDAYVKRYGNKVIYTPYFMTKKGVNGYTIKPEPRDNHLYKLGEEVIINAFLLSNCTGMLHCGTNVSTFAKFINNGKFEFEYQIFNGVNSSNPIISKYLFNIKKLLPSKLGGLKNEIRRTENLK